MRTYNAKSRSESPAKVKQVRCHRCGKLLFKAAMKEAVVEIMCYNKTCKAVHIFENGVCVRVGSMIYS